LSQLLSIGIKNTENICAKPKGWRLMVRSCGPSTGGDGRSSGITSQSYVNKRGLFMKTELETITPAMATKYLEHNQNNRPIRQNHVRFLASEISCNRWKENGATIVFNGKDLIDGQHRLWAVIEAGIPIKSLVVHDVDKDSFETIDTGLVRTAGDVLSILGHKSGATVAAAARFCINYEKGLITRPHWKLGNTQIAEYVQRHKSLISSAAYINELAGEKRWLIGTGLAIALHSLMAKKDQALADDLFAGIKEGFSDSSPATFRFLRERLINMSMGKGKSSQSNIAVYTIKAWNAARNGEILKLFKWVGDEEAPKIE
jgi:hypothetical protein